MQLTSQENNKCVHSQNARKIITINRIDGQVKHEYCLSCGQHLINGVWHRILFDTVIATDKDGNDLLNKKGEQVICQKIKFVPV